MDSSLRARLQPSLAPAFSWHQTAPPPPVIAHLIGVYVLDFLAVVSVDIAHTFPACYQLRRAAPAFIRRRALVEYTHR
jgi:hypothetical protein